MLRWLREWTKRLIMVKQKDTIPADQQEGYIVTLSTVTYMATAPSVPRPSRQHNSILIPYHHSPTPLYIKSPIQQPVPHQKVNLRFAHHPLTWETMSKNTPAASASASEPTATVLFDLPCPDRDAPERPECATPPRLCTFRFNSGGFWSAQGVGRMRRFWALGI